MDPMDLPSGPKSTQINPKIHNPPGPIVVRDNTFANEQDRATVFVRNFSATPAELSGNVLTGAVTPLAGAGTVR